MPPTDPDVKPFAAYRGMKVMVTGGAGFIGSNLVHRLARLGAEVVAVDCLLPDSGANPANLLGTDGRVRLETVDIRDDMAMRALVPGCRMIFNLAAQISHLESMNDPATDLEINALGPVRLLEACRALNLDATIVYGSTRQIYGKPDALPVDESHPLRPVDVNGINKQAGEAYHMLYHRVYGMKTVSLRLTNTYGPRMRIKDARQTFVGIWLRRVLEDAAFEVWGGEQRRDLAYVDDVVEALLLAAVTPAAVGQIYNIGGAPPVTLDELARLLVEVGGAGRFERHEFPPERKRIDIGDYYADDRRFRRDTGWAPRVELAEGLVRSLTFYRANPTPYL